MSSHLIRYEDDALVVVGPKGPICYVPDASHVRFTLALPPEEAAVFDYLLSQNGSRRVELGDGEIAVIRRLDDHARRLENLEGVPVPTIDEMTPEAAFTPPVVDTLNESLNGLLREAIQQPTVEPVQQPTVEPTPEVSVIEFAPPAEQPAAPARRRRRLLDPLRSIADAAVAEATAEIDAIDTEYVRVDYDVPQNTGYSWHVPDWLRARGAFQSSLSSYVIKTSRFPRAVLAAARAHGHTMRLWRMHPSDMAQAHRDAVQATEKALIELHTSLITAIDDAATNCQRLQDELSEGERTEKALTAIAKKKQSKQRAALKLARTRLEWAIKCAEEFDLTGEIGHCLQGIRDALSSYHAAEKAGRLEEAVAEAKQD